jgi:nucleoside-diphosphate-sugar epimerase
MKVLITGGNGFVGRNVSLKLKNCDVTTITRNEVDLCDSDQVHKFFKHKQFDVVVHTAVVGGKRLEKDGPEVVQNNLLMFYNLMNNRSKFNRLINIGSGSELDKRFPVDKNTDLLERFPVDPYGMSKHIISRILLDLENVSHLRVFGLLGEDEPLYRFFRSNIIRAIKGEDIIVHQNKIMDFFYIGDLINLIQTIIDIDRSVGCVTCSYTDSGPFTLIELAEKIKTICGSDSQIKVINDGIDHEYCGHIYPLAFDLPKFVGIDQGIKNIYLAEKEKHNEKN